MFDVSFTELMVIGVIALIVIGPERLPKVAKTVGHLLGRAQRYVSDVKGDIRREIELDELRQFKSEMDEASQSVQASLRETESALRTPGDQLRQVLDETARDARAGLDGTTPESTAVAANAGTAVTSASGSQAGSLHAADAALTPPNPAPATPPITAPEAFPLSSAGTEPPRTTWMRP